MKQGKQFKGRGRLALLLAAMLALSPAIAPRAAQAATAPYTTLTEDNRGDLIAAPDGYLPGDTFSVFAEERLDNPQDLCFGDDGLIYIADTGNKRIVACNEQGETVRIFTAGKLKKPSGVSVREGILYVADPSLKAIVLYDTATGEELRRFTKPEEPLYGENVRFEPLRIQADSAGSMYFVSNGNSNGVAMLAADGGFLGYYGANHTAMGVGMALKRMLYTADMMKSVRMNIPNTPSNLTMDSRGLLYTATTGAGPDAVKKFSMAGQNMIDPLTRLDDYIVDVAVGPYENIFAASSLGYLYEYSRDGRLLFFFGGEDRTGSRDVLFKSLASICIGSKDTLYALDSGKNLIQSFHPTGYADTLHQALRMYQEGLYAESKESWEKVLERNNLFDFAYAGLGQAYYKTEDWQNALKYFRLSGEKEGYSDTFWELRAVWMQEHFLILLIAAAAGLIALRLLKGRWKGRLPRAIAQTGIVCRVIQNPADAFYRVKRENALSVGGAAWLYGVFFLLLLAGKYGTAFIFKSVPDGEYAIGTDLAVAAGLMLLFQVSLNLVCSTRQSEARAVDIFRCVPLALAPYFLVKPLLIAVSYALTYNERFLMSFGAFLMLAGCAVLMVVMVRELQNYSYGETIRVLLLTAFVMFVLALSLMVCAILGSQFLEFIVSLGKEAGNALFS